MAVRLRIIADVEDRSPRDTVKLQLVVDLADGRCFALLDDRGFTSTENLEAMRGDYIADTARVVVGPDGPAHGETHDQMRMIYWEMLATKLTRLGVATSPSELAVLPQEVEFSDRLRRRLQA